MVSLSALVGCAQAEVDAAVVLRKIAGACGALGDLLASGSQQFQARSNAVAIALLPYQLHSEPVIAVLSDVVQKQCGSSQVHDEGVDLAVIVVVGEAGATRDGFHVEHRTGFAGDIGELAVSETAKQRLLLRDEVNQPPWKIRMSSQPSLSKS